MSGFFVLLHNIRSLYNVGSIFRTADCFSVDKIFLTGYTGTPPEAKISKVALGAENTVPWEYSLSPVRLIRRLKNQYPGLKVVGLENNLRQKTKLLSKYRFQFPLLLILGEEVGGIRKNLLELCDDIIEIPQAGKKESLNVSVAFGVAAYVISSEKGDK